MRTKIGWIIHSYTQYFVKGVFLQSIMDNHKKQTKLMKKYAELKRVRKDKKRTNIDNCLKNNNYVDKLL